MGSGGSGARLRALILDPGLGDEAVLARFLVREPEPTLALDDFPHLREDLATVVRILARALETRAPGINVLLHGAHGAGRNEAARLVARLAGASRFLVGAQDDRGESPSGRERLASLQLGNRLLATAPALLLMDELDDLHSANGPWDRIRVGDGASLSKIFLDRLMENARVPTTWI